ncbi:MAG: multicopper oxidase family protein [Gemmatimonadaceae bacterium]|nr:multicopper oxidase family protein [Gemmatimonadaceae bacterium]
MTSRRLIALLALAGALAGSTTGAQDRPCDAQPTALAPSRDLYCIELIAAPGIRNASGRVELGRIPGPFTIAVAADGRLLHQPVITLAGLPPPASLGAFTTYVAWVATPVMHPVTKLGEVRNGRNVLATIALEKFIILITAEESPGVDEPRGKVVLRGQSPATRLQPPDVLQFAFGAGPLESDTAHAADAHAAHMAQAPPRGADVSWTTVPMPPGLQMLPAEMALRPGVEPYLPSAREGQDVHAARPRELVPLNDGDTLRLDARLVRRTFKGRSYTMYGFNGQYPGPLIRVPQHAEIVVQFTNRLDQPTTVHWHGVRLENRFDGVPDLTQEPVQPGGSFTYRVRFPDAGIYWYHPHVREDIQQDLGLYGNLLVRSPRADWFGAANREEVLMLDDLLVGDDGLVPFGREAATHAFMGRFGNVFLVNGEPGYRLSIRRGEVVRFLLTNASNTRAFNLSFGGARMKVVASDVGNYEREEWIESVVIAPAERYVVHVRFDEPGEIALLNRVYGLDHFLGRFFAESDTLGIVRVSSEPASPDHASAFRALRRDSAAVAGIARFREHFDRPVDKSLVLTLRAHDLPFVTERLMQLDSIYFAPVEWSGTMPMMNWASTARQVTWVLRDPATGKENMDIDWRFRAGDVVKLRISNERKTFHAMQHPIHIHGQRFLVLSVNGVPNENLVWKDTVLLPAGAMADILVEMSNPGRWMLHCHIAEHLSADMMLAFTVE